MSLSKQTPTEISAPLIRRWYAALFDISLFVTFVLWPAVTVLNGVIAFDGLAKTILGLTWLTYNWSLQRFTGATLGQRLFGYRIVPTGGKSPLYLLRVISGYFGFIWSIYTLVSDMKSTDDIFWWDKRSRTRALLMKEPDAPYWTLTQLNLPIALSSPSRYAPRYIIA